MNSIAGWAHATALVILASVYPQISFAEKFTGAEFLTWSEEGQNTYIGTSVTMATMVASRTNPETGNCLDRWYAASEAVAEERNREIRQTIARNSEYHPSAVILLVMEGACGSFAGE